MYLDSRALPSEEKQPQKQQMGTSTVEHAESFIKSYFMLLE